MKQSFPHYLLPGISESHENKQPLKGIMSHRSTGCTQLDSSLEATRRPQQIAMDHRLMKAVRSGDREQLVNLLSPEAAAPNSTTEEARITVPEDDVSLLGVTAGGNTALHIAVGHGHLELAEELCCRETSLVTASNKKFDTPLHYAARARDRQMVDLIIRFARAVGEGEVLNIVLRAKNRDGDTGLHEATKNGRSEVTQSLLKHDAELASMVNDAGISPLYFAVMSGSLDVVQALIKYSFEETTDQISTVGPDGRTALHAAVFQSREITEELLRWKPALAMGVDNSGSTPLHYVASSGQIHTLELLLEYDRWAAYLPNKSGLMPIHLAASRGNISMIKELMKHCPDAEELLDRYGHNFLHVAILAKKEPVVRYVCRNQKFEKLMNEQNYMGETPLHLAVFIGDQRIVSLLMQCKSLQISIMNKMGFTPLDLSLMSLERGFHFVMNPQDWIFQCLAGAGATSSPRGPEYFIRGILNPDPVKETKKHLNMAGNIGIISVLIATVTFAATLTMPGGYEADDNSPHPGATILARKYAFKVFVISDTLSLVCSITATRWLIYAGSLAVDLNIRSGYLIWANRLMHVAAKSMVVAFALGVYVVLSPIAKRFSIVVCVVCGLAITVWDWSTLYPTTRLGVTLVKRLGWREGLFKSHLNQAARRIGIPMINVGRRVSFVLLSHLLIYSFMLALALL